MKVMYVVSPDYLLAFEKESEEFSFYIQGYREFVPSTNQSGIYKTAISELYKTNINDIVGFIVLVDDLQYYINDLNLFLQQANMVCQGHRRRVVIGSISAKSDKYLSMLNPTPNLDIYRVTNIGIVTDTVIKRELFGTIIMGKAPYKFLDSSNTSTTYKDLPVLKYKPIFSKVVLGVLDPVTVISDDFRKVLSYDSVYRSLLDEGEDILAFIRLIKIANTMGLKIDTEGLEYRKFKESVENSNLKVLYNALVRNCGGVGNEQ